MKIKEEFWKAQENESIEGIVVEINDNVGKYDNTLYKIKVKDKIYCIWASVELNELFKNVQILDRVYLKYLGKTKTGNFYKKNYELNVL